VEFSKQLECVAKEMGCRYTVKGEPMPLEQVFSITGLLPALLRRADQLCTFCLGYGLGVTFERSDAAKLGVVAQMDLTTPNILRLLCVTDILHEFMQQAAGADSISLDELLSD
jgi:intracellular multiplication protein IcmS